jgi:hypothetical protein
MPTSASHDPVKFRLRIAEFSPKEVLHGMWGTFGMAAINVAAAKPDAPERFAWFVSHP